MGDLRSHERVLYSRVGCIFGILNSVLYFCSSKIILVSLHKVKVFNTMREIYDVGRGDSDLRNQLVCGEICLICGCQRRNNTVFQPSTAHLAGNRRGTRQPTIPTGQKQPGSRSWRPEFCRDPSTSDPGPRAIPGPAPALVTSEEEDHWRRPGPPGPSAGG